MARKLTLLITALALLAPASAGAAYMPPGFIGISPQDAPRDDDYEVMAKAGVKSIRLPLFWFGAEPVSPLAKQPDWGGFDRGVELAAKYRMRVLPFVWGSPSWVTPEPQLEPVAQPWQRQAWASFLRRAVRRYGPRGAFWRQNPELPRLPVRAWEIWNEQNIVPFGSADPERFARLIRVSGHVLRREDPGARLILGGFFGRPLQVPPNEHAARFLVELYRLGMKRWFQGVGWHPYVAEAGAMRNQIRNLRRVMQEHGDGAKPLYITEMGWGSNGNESRWERGWRGQARQLDRAFAMLTHHRRAWRIGGVWWFSLADASGPACQFCDSSGLLTVDREAKPSWYRFNAWTRGDPRGVARASFPSG